MKQQQLIFDKGITNTPSDTICSDNALQEEVGLTYRDGEHRVIQAPTAFMSNAYSILYIHKLNDEERYITKDGTDIHWGTKNESDSTYSDEGVLMAFDGTPIISSVGKTIIIADNDGLHYFLWTNTGYTDLGSRIPDPEVRFCLIPQAFANRSIANTFLVQRQGSIWEVDTGKEEQYDNAAIGLYSEIKDAVHDSSNFINPFAVRVALKLYDDSYTMMSNPVYLFPSINRNSEGGVDGNDQFYVMTRHPCKLYYSADFDYTLWADIVKEVVVFASNEIEVHDFDVTHHNPTLPSTGDNINGIYADALTYKSSFVLDSRVVNFWPLSLKSNEILTRELSEISVFYRISNLGTTSVSVGSLYSPCPIEPHVIKNLTTQESITTDEYFSRCPLVPKMLYAYNSRLNMASVRRGFFEGFSHFMPYDNSSAANYEIYVTIETDSGTFVKKHAFSGTEKQGFYFYYPDPRAKYVVIKKGNDYILNASMKEHQFLHGAYYFKGIDDQFAHNGYTEEALPATPSAAYITPSENAVEILPNYIIQSEVNNPFVFKAEGYQKVGTGKIIGLSTQTKALSEGQFGQFPMLVFSESGIWAMPVTSEGLFSSVQPMSREVALIDNPCITQTDGAVFFASKKGLMVVVGGDVSCVSEQMNGLSATPFHSFLEHAFIAYDYRDSLLWLFDKEGSSTCYIYNIKGGTFSKFTFVDNITIGNVVNDYPDYLLQNGTNVYSLLTRANINDDENTYTATIKTRPMKLENGLALKSILQMRHICQFADEGSLSLRIFASNNLQSWVELKSLHGTPWKYYRFEYTFNGLKATDTFAGTMLITDERRSLRLR